MDNNYIAAYFTRQEPCGPGHPEVSEEILRERAGGIFNAVGQYWPRRVITDDEGEREELDFSTKIVGDLAILEIPPGDFGGFAVLHRCSGLVLYAGSIVWSGTGEQFYPAEPIRADALLRQKKPVSSPKKMDIIIGPDVYSVENERGIDAWNSVQDLNIVQDLAASPYEVLIYLYPRTVGEFNAANASWVVFVQRNPET